MLKGIDPLLTPCLLTVLAEACHGDEIVLADANFTALIASGMVTLQQYKPIECSAYYARVNSTCAIICTGVLQLYAKLRLEKKSVLGEALRG